MILFIRRPFYSVNKTKTKGLGGKYLIRNKSDDRFDQFHRQEKMRGIRTRLFYVKFPERHYGRFKGIPPSLCMEKIRQLYSRNSQFTEVTGGEVYGPLSCTRVYPILNPYTSTSHPKGVFNYPRLIPTEMYDFFSEEHETEKNNPSHPLRYSTVFLKNCDQNVVSSRLTSLCLTSELFCMETVFSFFITPLSSSSDLSTVIFDF